MGYTANDLALKLNFNAGSTLAVVDNSGNVGIGVTSPAAIGKLVVSGSVVSNAATTSYDQNGIQLSYDSNVGVVSSSNASGGAISFRTNPAAGFTAERLRIDSSGNVGIGTTSPDSVLSVYAPDKTTPAISARYNAAGFKAGLSVYNALGFPYLSFNANPVAGATNNATYDINGVASKIDFATGSGSADIIFSNAASGTAGSTISWLERMRIDSAGDVGIGTTTPVNKLEIVGSFGRGAPVTKTADFSLADTENWLIVNKGSSCTVTLPAASSWTGREFTIKTIQAFAVVSASSNVIPRIGGAAGTAILPATDGAWATLVSNGTTWEIMCGS